MTAAKISIIAPVFNESATLKPLYHQIRDVMGTIGSPDEIIFVDDGSTDCSLDIMEQIYGSHQERTSTVVDDPIPSYRGHEEISASERTFQLVVIQFRHIWARRWLWYRG
jgi:glycosyltransferase involved in cell wall biosynthesis